MKRKIFAKPSLRMKALNRFIKILALLAALFGILALLYFETPFKVVFIVLMAICVILDLVIWQIMLNQIYRMSRTENGDNFHDLFTLFALYQGKEKQRGGKNE
ncbi:MAG: hypothetical protein QG648_190 [Patescibacteria group bacterium]|nr:hypothetical protein [Patescibacteria group bacterium]